jgi:hypothetical protein
MRRRLNLLKIHRTILARSTFATEFWHGFDTVKTDWLLRDLEKYFKIKELANVGA